MKYTANMLRVNVSPFFEKQDEMVAQLAKDIIKGFEETLDKWLLDKELYSNTYRTHLFSLNVRNLTPFDEERAIKKLKESLSKELAGSGFWSNVYAPEHYITGNDTPFFRSITIDISWEI